MPGDRGKKKGDNKEIYQQEYFALDLRAQRRMQRRPKKINQNVSIKGNVFLWKSTYV